MRAKSQTGFAVKSPKGRIWLCTISQRRKDSVTEFIKAWRSGTNWKEMYRKGYRVINVKVEQI